MKNPTGQECQSAEVTYDMRLNEYRAFLGWRAYRMRTTRSDLDLEFGFRFSEGRTTSKDTPSPAQRSKASHQP